MLESESASTERAASDLNCLAIAPAPHVPFLVCALMCVDTCGHQRTPSGVGLYESRTVFSEKGSLIGLGLVDVAKLICS